MSDDFDDRDYEVGYGKPPKRTQFKKGKSGNPKGRPKGAKGVHASLKRELESRITIQEGGRKLSMPKAEAMAKQLTNKAITGDMKALMALLKVDENLYGNATEQLAEDKKTSTENVDAVDYEI